MSCTLYDLSLWPLPRHWLCHGLGQSLPFTLRSDMALGLRALPPPVSCRPVALDSPALMELKVETSALQRRSPSPVGPVLTLSIPLPRHDAPRHRGTNPPRLRLDPPPLRRVQRWVKHSRACSPWLQLPLLPHFQSWETQGPSHLPLDASHEKCLRRCRLGSYFLTLNISPSTTTTGRSGRRGLHLRVQLRTGPRTSSPRRAIIIL